MPKGSRRGLRVPSYIIMARVFTVSELSRQIRDNLETAFPFVWVRGQVSNLSRPASGHVYFSLKDEGAVLGAVWFRSESRASTAFDPFTGEVFEGGGRPHLALTMEDGQEVLAAGRISLYGPRGACQLVVELLQEAGIGRLQQAFEELRLELEAKGWFAAERKRALPVNPKRVAVVTSLQGAALQDFLRIAGPRGLGGCIRIHPTLVQGAEAPTGIVQALEEINAQGWAEAAVLIRGGGSLEDLWAFNDRAVAEAVFNSHIPVLSGVGHEVDVTICDLVADMRAATPSHAAQLLWTEREIFAQRVDEADAAMHRAVNRGLVRCGERLDLLERGLTWLSPRRAVEDLHVKLTATTERLHRVWSLKIESWQEAVERCARTFRLEYLQRRLAGYEERLSAAESRLGGAMRHALVFREKSLAGPAATLRALDPHLPLTRGYTLTQLPSGELLRSVNEAKPGMSLDIIVRDGRVNAEVRGTFVEKVPTEE